MRDGTINPEDVKVAGIESDEEKAAAEVLSHPHSLTRFFIDEFGACYCSAHCLFSCVFMT